MYVVFVFSLQYGWQWKQTKTNINIPLRFDRESFLLSQLGIVRLGSDFHISQIYRRCPCGFIVSNEWWTKSFVFLKSFSPSVISHNRSAMKCDELRYMKTRLNGHYKDNLTPWLVGVLSVNLPRGKSPHEILEHQTYPTNLPMHQLDIFQHNIKLGIFSKHSLMDIRRHQLLPLVSPLLSMNLVETGLI